MVFSVLVVLYSVSLCGVFSPHNRHKPSMLYGLNQGYDDFVLGSYLAVTLCYTFSKSIGLHLQLNHHLADAMNTQKTFICIEVCS